MNPRTIEGPEWWELTRRRAYEENNFCCHACGVNKVDAKYRQWLEAHECYEYDYESLKARFVGVVALCRSCHAFIHWRRIALRPGRVNLLKEVLLHGLTVLAEGGIDLPEDQLSYVQHRGWDSELEWLADTADAIGLTTQYWDQLLATGWKLEYKGKEYPQ